MKSSKGTDDGSVILRWHSRHNSKYYVYDKNVVIWGLYEATIWYFYMYTEFCPRDPKITASSHIQTVYPDVEPGFLIPCLFLGVASQSHYVLLHLCSCTSPSQMLVEGFSLTAAEQCFAFLSFSVSSPSHSPPRANEFLTFLSQILIWGSTLEIHNSLSWISPVNPKLSFSLFSQKKVDVLLTLN